MLWTYADKKADGSYARIGGGCYLDPATGHWTQGAYNADDIARTAVVYLRHWQQPPATPPARNARSRPPALPRRTCRPPAGRTPATWSSGSRPTARSTPSAKTGGIAGPLRLGRVLLAGAHRLGPRRRLRGVPRHRGPRRSRPSCRNACKLALGSLNKQSLAKFRQGTTRPTASQGPRLADRRRRRRFRGVCRARPRRLRQGRPRRPRCHDGAGAVSARASPAMSSGSQH